MDRFPNWKSGELLLEQELQPAHPGGRTARFYSIRYCITPTFPTRKSIGIGDYIRPLGTCQLFIYSAFRAISPGLWNTEIPVSQGVTGDPVPAFLTSGTVKLKGGSFSGITRVLAFRKGKDRPDGKGRVEAYSGTSRWRR